MFWLLPWALAAEVTLFVILIFLVQLEKFGWSVTLIIASLIIYAILGHFFKWPKVSDVFTKDNFWLSLRYFGYYLAGAVLWSYEKWLFYLWNFRSERDKAVKKYREQRAESPSHQGELTVEDIRANLGHIRYKRGYLSLTPSAKEYKGMIVSWGIWWPASLIGTLVDDPVRKLINLVFDLLSGLYQKAADKIVPEIKL